jgi:hypothetical protein
MSEMFDQLRSDLSKLSDEWQPKLDTIWSEIRRSKHDDRDLQLARIIEYNRFKDLLYTMQRLHNDKDAINRYSMKIASIRCQLEYENIGDEILKLVEKVEKLVKDNDSINTITANIKKCITLIKRGEEVIPLNRQKDLINRLNRCIIDLNKRIDNPIQGIIIQLREDKDFVHDVAFVINIECKDCGYVFECSGHFDRDIYAPPVCPKCNSCELFQSKKSIITISTKYLNPFKNFISCFKKSQ